MEEMKKEYIHFKCTATEKKKMDAHAKLNGFSTVSDYVRTAISAYMNKDIVWQSQVQGAIESLRSEIHEAKRNIDLQSKLAMFFYEYFFMYQQDIENLPEKQKLIIRNNGVKRNKAMIQEFKKEMRKYSSIMETILADYVIEDKEEN